MTISGDSPPASKRINIIMVRALCRVVMMGLLMSGLLLAPNTGLSEEGLPSSDRMWSQVLKEAHALGLPTKFLTAVPPSFVRFEFDDLHSYAAEYHLGEHRMVLNRALSFNGAGATLRPLGNSPIPRSKRCITNCFTHISTIWCRWLRHRQGLCRIPCSRLRECSRDVTMEGC